MPLILGQHSTVFHSLEKENDKLCLYPWSGLVVNPDGRILACCHSPTNTLSHINNVESLNDFFNDASDLKVMRKSFKEHTIPRFPCNGCSKRYEDGFTPAFKRKNPNLPFDEDNYFGDGRKLIRYLEITPSNLCNQACVMCGSKYSSMWDTIDQIALKNDEIKFRYDDINNHRTAPIGTYTLSDKDWSKIIDCIEEGVAILYIKGGEPFADERNIDLLERVGNGEFPQLRKIALTTNFKRLNKRIINIIKKLKEKKQFSLSVSISIDGVGKQYDWIRSSSWDRLVSNLNQITEEVNTFNYSVGITQTVYNYFNMQQLFDGVSKLPRAGNIHGQQCVNPKYLSTAYVVPENTIREYNEKYKEEICNNIKYNDRLKNDWIYYQPKRNLGDLQEHQERLKEFTTFMNKIRGFNIEEEVPEFAQFYQSI